MTVTVTSVFLGGEGEPPPPPPPPPPPAPPTVRLKTNVWVTPFPTPVTVITLVPVGAVPETEILRSLVPLPPVIVVGANTPVTPAGNPLADNATSELQPFTAVAVTTLVPDPPRAIVSEAAEGLMA